MYQMQIALFLSRPPAYSETFLRSKIIGLQKMGMDVVLFCKSDTMDFDLCPVFTIPNKKDNFLLQFLSFFITALSLIPHFVVVKKYIVLERKEGTDIINILKKIYLNAPLLKSKPDWLHFGFATMALGRETVARAIGAKMAVSLRGFDIAVYPV